MFFFNIIFLNIFCSNVYNIEYTRIILLCDSVKYLYTWTMLLFLATRGCKHSVDRRVQIRSQLLSRICLI